MKRNRCLFVALVLCGASLFAMPKVQQATLKNGIKVYVAHSDSRLFAIRIVVRGGAAFLDEDTSGLEGAAFSWMTYGSRKYDKKTIDDYSYNYLFSVDSSASQNDASLYVTCIDKYTKKALDVLCDMFINPAFNDDHLPLVLDSIKSNLAMKKEDPQSVLSDTISRVVYENHPYRVKSFVTDRSLPSITKENMVQLHERDMDSRRIFVAASGNITARSLASMLNRTIGKIPALDTPISEKIDRNVPPISLDGKGVLLTNKTLDGTGYMQWVSSGPAVTDADAPAAMVASEMYTRELFNVVREAHGACYSVESLCSVARIGMAGVYLHSVTDLAHATTYEKEARHLLMAGKIASSGESQVTPSAEPSTNGSLSHDGKQGLPTAASLVYEDASSSLEGIKNSFLNSYYEGSVSSSSVCSRMAYSISLLNDPVGYDALIERISTVTIEETLAAFKKYWTDGKWFAIVGTNDKDKTSLD